jgi:MYXO-CTERM domain-containing protein
MPVAASRRPRSTTGARWWSTGSPSAWVGAFVLGAFLLWRRRPDRQDPRYLGVLPDGFSATVAASLYGVAAAALALLSLDSFLVAEGDGTGQWLSAAIVAAAMAPTDS